jgi:hypothetical protein
LREVLDFLRDELGRVFEREGKKIFQDVWKARDGYIGVILNRSPEGIQDFFDQYGAKGLDEKGRVKGLKLLEIQRHALQMYTSCGWFFNDLAGIETIIVLQHASRAIQLAAEWTGEGVEKTFVQHLSEARSNVPEMGKGDHVYERLVKPKWVTPEKVVNHFAITSLLDSGSAEKKVFSYRVEKIHFEKMEREENLLVIGQVRVISEIIPEPKEFFFGLIPSKKEVFRTWVLERKEGLEFSSFKEKARESFGSGEEEMMKVLTLLLGNLIFTLRDTFKEERQAIFQKIVQKEFDEHCQVYADIFDRTKQAVEALSREGLEIPFEIRVAAEVTLSNRFIQEIKKLNRDFKGTVAGRKIDEIVEEAREHGFHLRKEKSLLALHELLMDRMNALQKNKGSDLSRQAELAEEVLALLNLANKWDVEMSLEEAQNSMSEILEECVGDLEQCWWENGTPKLFSPNLITLAEKMGFNVERFSKITGPGISEKQPQFVD